jgi:F0F1-type ATP synthase assembly protein I
MLTHLLLAMALGAGIGHLLDTIASNAYAGSMVGVSLGFALGMAMNFRTLSRIEEPPSQKALV